MKTVVITGVSRGIGRALAQKYLENSDFVIGTSTSGDADIHHENLQLFELDLADPKSIENFSNSLTQAGRKIDILHNNAAIWSDNENDPVVHVGLLRNVLEVDLLGTVDLTERLIPLMSEGGHIVNTSSRQGSFTFVQNPDFPDYKIAKAALNMYTRVLALRLKGSITVSAVHPGWVKTDMGGTDADLTPEEAAEHIFKLANSKVPTGQFWF